MNWEQAPIAIYFILGLLYIVAAHAIFYRVIFVDRHIRLCPDMEFFDLLLQMKTERWDLVRSRYRKNQLGWLNHALDQTSLQGAATAVAVTEDHYDVYLDVLRLVGGLGTLFGLLGTVSAFLVSDNVNEVGLNAAFATTMIGIIVSIPPAVYLGVTARKRKKFESQAGQIMEFVMNSNESQDSDSNKVAAGESVIVFELDENHMIQPAESGPAESDENSRSDANDAPSKPSEVEESSLSQSEEAIVLTSDELTSRRSVRERDRGFESNGVPMSKPGPRKGKPEVPTKTNRMDGLAE